MATSNVILLGNTHNGQKAGSGQVYVRDINTGTVLLRPESNPLGLPSAPAVPNSPNPSNGTSQNPLPYNTLSNDIKQKAYNDQMSQLETNYNRYVANSNVYETQALQNKQLNLEGAMRQAQVGYQDRGFTGNSGALAKDIGQNTQPAMVDIAQTKQNYDIDRSNAQVQKQQAETNLSNQQAMGLFDSQGAGPAKAFFNSLG